MLTTQIYKGTIKPDYYPDEVELRIKDTLNIENIAVSKDSGYEILLKIPVLLWFIALFGCIGALILQVSGIYLYFTAGFLIVTAMLLIVIRKGVPKKELIGNMKEEYFKSLKENNIYKYKGTLEEVYAPTKIKNEIENGWFIKVDGHMWQVNKEDYEAIKELKTLKVDIYFVKYENLGKNLVSLMVKKSDT